MHKLALFIFLILQLSCNLKSKKSDETGIKINNEIQHPNTIPLILEKATSGSLINKANIYWDKSKLDSAFIYFNKARELAVIENDSINIASSLTNMGILTVELGDIFNGQEYSLKALKILSSKNKKHHPYLLSNYNNLGISNYDLKNSNKAIEFYHKSLKIIQDSNSLHTTKNNLANAYRQLKSYKMAIKLYKEILANNPNKNNESRVLTNLAKTELLLNPTFNPIPLYSKALKIRKNNFDKWGENSSYSHITEYYINKNTDSAFHYANKMYNLAKTLNNPDNKLNALNKLILIDSYDRLNHFKTYKQLEDSISQARTQAKNQFAIIQFETEKHKLENIQLNNENNKKTIQIQQKNFGLILSGIMIISVISIGGLIFNYRKKKVHLNAQKQIKDAQINTSKEVHDVVANGLYKIMSEIEYGKTIHKDKLIIELDTLYKKSRFISYTVSTKTINFIDRINDLVHAFSSPKIKISTVGLDEKLNHILNENLKDQILLCLQEILINMNKHSKANQVVLIINSQSIHKSFILTYKDNGIGLQFESNYGIGFSNTESRINSLGGDIKFDSVTGKGLTIQIHIPLKD